VTERLRQDAQIVRLFESDGHGRPAG